MKTTFTLAILAMTTSFGPAMADGAKPLPVTRGLLDTILRAPGAGSRSTYEDLLANLTRPIRLYDFDGDGLSAVEVDQVTALYAQGNRASLLGQMLRFDLNNDRTVTSAEFDTASRIAAASGNGFLPRLAFDTADLNHDGQVTLDEMTTLPPDRLDRDGVRLRSVTIDVDPTPETNFTLADARAVLDAVFATYDTNRNGVLDTDELRVVR